MSHAISPTMTTKLRSSAMSSRQSSLGEVTDATLRRELMKLPWRVIRRPKQAPPDGDWFVWLILAGRGWGKAQTGAEFVIERMAVFGDSLAKRCHLAFDRLFLSLLIR